MMSVPPLSERAVCRCLLWGAVKGISDHSQRRIKTSAPHFTSISPTLLEHCASAVEVNKRWLFVPLRTATHSSLTRSISAFFLYLFPFFFSFRLSLSLHYSLSHSASYWTWNQLTLWRSPFPAHIQYAWYGSWENLQHDTCSHVQPWSAGWAGSSLSLPLASISLLYTLHTPFIPTSVSSHASVL